MEEHGLGLIVARVTGRDRGRAEFARDAAQEFVARVARVVLALRCRVRTTDAHRRADVVRELRDERGVRGCCARARAMIEVRDVEHEPELLAQLREDETERGRIGSAGDGEHERTGTQDRVGARVANGRC